MRGLGESLFHRRRIAFLPCQADIVGRLLVKTRRTGRQCRSEVDDWVERRVADIDALDRSEEHTSELQSLMRISYAVFCLKKKKKKKTIHRNYEISNQQVEKNTTNRCKK